MYMQSAQECRIACDASFWAWERWLEMAWQMMDKEYGPFEAGDLIDIGAH